MRYALVVVDVLDGHETKMASLTINIGDTVVDPQRSFRANSISWEFEPEKCCFEASPNT